MTELNVGDLVQLKSGSDVLTVDEVSQNEVIVVYFHGFKQQFEQFKLNKESVVKVEIKGDKE